MDNYSAVRSPTSAVSRPEQGIEGLNKLSSPFNDHISHSRVQGLSTLKTREEVESQDSQFLQVGKNAWVVADRAKLLQVPCQQHCANFSHNSGNIRFNRHRRPGPPSPSQRSEKLIPPPSASDYLTTRINFSTEYSEMEISTLKTRLLASLAKVLAPSEDHKVEFHKLKKSPPEAQNETLNLEAEEEVESESQQFLHPTFMISDQSIESEVQYLTSAQLFYICTANKQVSLRFQECITTCSETTFRVLAKLVKPVMSSLCLDRYGNYAVQKFVNRDTGLKKLFQQLALKDFVAYASNEFSSRVMQLCVTQEDSFRQAVLEKIRKNLHQVCRVASSVFLFCVSVRASPTEADYYFIVDFLISDPRFWLCKKLFKRMLVSVLQHGSEETATTIYECVRNQMDMDSFLGDKFSLHLVLAFLERSFKPAERELTARIWRDVHSFMRLRFFRLFLSSCVAYNLKDVLYTLHSALTAEKVIEWSLEVGSTFDYYFYCYSVLMSGRRETFIEKLSFWVQLDRYLAGICPACPSRDG